MPASRPERHRTFEHGVRLVFGVEQERKIDDREFLGQAVQEARIHQGQLDRSALQRRDDLQVAPKGAVAVYLDGDPAVGLLVGEFGKPVRPVILCGAGDGLRGELERDLRMRAGSI